MKFEEAACLMRAVLAAGALVAAGLTAPVSAQEVDNVRGVDSRVDYGSMVELGPWDDRNLLLTKEGLALLAANERELKDPIPVFFRVELRKTIPGMLREGNAQYPRSALQIFKLRYRGYLFEGRIYPEAVMRDGRFHLVRKNSMTPEEAEDKALTGDVKLTTPTGAAESAIKISPVDLNKVIAGSNGPGSGQKMWYSSNGGSTWSAAAALPLGSTCCDPTVDWSADGTKAYTSTLGGCGALCNIWVYRSGDAGQTWSDLGADPRRELTSANTSDKQYIHVDRYATSPHRDNVYVCWHDNNTLKFSRSTDFAQTFGANLSMSSGSSQSGIGCDLASDQGGNVYYFWPATNGKTILMRKSTDGGATFASAVTVANTQDGYDFAIPAMETRRAFIYSSADADISGGAFASSIYVAWTDTTAAESGTPANNHGRIQVAYSRNGGATWTVRTPHSTADAATVDRFHPWLGVGPDGKVYVIFYDTRNSPTRVGVDIYYSVSSDGGDTWAAPARMTGVTSPQIDDSFEWGDYNGMDIMGTQLISIFTDNRNEGGGTADSIDVYAAGVTVGGPCTPPATPTGLTATAVSSSQINLSWTASAGATSYNVYRSTTSGGPYSSVGSSATTTFNNTGLAASTTYYYVVRAVGGCESGNSGQASATTLAPPLCTTTTLYNRNFDAATGLDGFTVGTFVSGGSTVSWRGVQTCTAASGTRIFRYGGTSCTTDYGSNQYNYAQANGAGGITIPAGSTTSRLTFKHRRRYESGYDGGTLRISTNGSSYTSVPASAILAGGYNGTASTSCAPAGAGGTSIWTGVSAAFTTTTVDLDAACNAIPGNVGGCAGKAVRIAFTSITDCTVLDDGWFLDDIAVQACVP